MASTKTLLLEHFLPLLSLAPGLPLSLMYKRSEGSPVWPLVCVFFAHPTRNGSLASFSKFRPTDEAVWGKLRQS